MELESPQDLMATTQSSLGSVPTCSQGPVLCRAHLGASHSSPSSGSCGSPGRMCHMSRVTCVSGGPHVASSGPFSHLGAPSEGLPPCPCCLHPCCLHPCCWHPCCLHPCGNVQICLLQECSAQVASHAVLCSHVKGPLPCSMSHTSVTWGLTRVMSTP